MNSTEPEYFDKIRFAQATRDKWLALNMVPLRSANHAYPWAFKNREAQRRYEWYLELQSKNVHRVVEKHGDDLICSCGLICRNTRDAAALMAAPGHLLHVWPHPEPEVNRTA